VCCEDVIDVIFKCFSRNSSCLDVDEGVAWNSLKVYVSHACSLFERLADRAVALRTGRAGEHEGDPLFLCEGVVREAAHEDD
jgi:hypothetical protein